MRIAIAALMLSFTIPVSVSKPQKIVVPHIEQCSPGPLLVAMAQYISKRSRRAPAIAIAEAVLEAAEEYDVDPMLVLAVIEIESMYKPRTTGSLGERGLMQIRRSTARVLGLPWDSAYSIRQNVRAGAKYLAQHVDRYGSIERAASRYNGGSRRYAKLVSTKYYGISASVSGLRL